MPPDPRAARLASCDRPFRFFLTGVTLARPPDLTPGFPEFLAELRLAAADPSFPKCSPLLNQLRGHLRKALGRQDELRQVMDSEDLAQDGLIRLIKAIHRFEGDSWPQLVSFARTLTEQAKIDEARKMRAGIRPPPGGPAADELIPDVQTPTPSRVLLSREQREAITRAIGGLDEGLRGPLRQRLAGQSYEDIAKQFGISKVAARQRVSRALSSLSDDLRAKLEIQ